MAEENRKIIRVSGDSEKSIKTYAEKNGITIGEAADKLIFTAVSRLAALSRYAKNQKAEAKPKAAKPKKKKSSEAAPKKPKKEKQASEANGAAHA